MDRPLQLIESGHLPGGGGLPAAPSCALSARPRASRPARILDRLPAALLGLAVLPMVAVVVATPGLDPRGMEQGYRAMQAAVATLALAALLLAAWRRPGEARRVCLALAVIGGLVAASLYTGGIERALTGISSLTGIAFLLAIVGAIAVFTPLIFRRASRTARAAAWLDTAVFLAAATIALGIAWGTVATAAKLPAPGVLAGLVVITAWSASTLVMLLALNVRPRAGGPYAMVAGIGTIAVACLGYLATLNAAGYSPTAPALELLFAAGVVAGAYGAVTWSLDPDPAMATSVVARTLRDLLPTGSIMVAIVAFVVLEQGPQQVPMGFAIARLAVIAGVVIAGARQVLLLVYERRARAAEQASAEELASHVAERQQVTRALAGLEVGDSIEATAQRVCERAIQLPGVGFAILARVTGDGDWIPVAAAGLDHEGLVGRPLDAGHVERIRDRLEGGAWRESASPWLDPFLAEAQLADVARIPMRSEDRVIGLLTLGCRSQVSAADGERRLMVVREAAVVATALLAPALAAEEALHRRRTRLDAVIAAEAFHPVYQPIVDLETGAVRGYEALTRFADGTRPDLVFQEAAEVGRGIELELATLAVAARESVGLPPDAYLSLNLSPEVASRPELLGPLLTRLPRDLMLEITEHVPVADYELLMASVYALDLRVRIAVDDAGAGYAGLTHILAVRPHVVKLDVSLVRSVDLDLARQALVGSMVTFALRTGASVVAEGVETAGEAAMLRSLGVTMGQGYFFGRPERIAPPVEATVAAN